MAAPRVNALAAGVRSFAEADISRGTLSDPQNPIYQ